jgi:hypothetical protein
MKNLKRFVFGLISSALLAVGFAHAAETLDPLNRDAGAVKEGALVSTTATGQYCGGPDVTN